jgi:hypothetical protein
MTTRAKCASVVILVILTLASIGLVASAPPARAAPPPPYTSVAGTLVDKGVVGSVSPYFWSVATQTAVPTGIASNPNVGVYLNDSPFAFFRYGQGADECDIANNTQYSAPASGHGVFVASKPCDANITSFKTWCDSFTPQCLSIVQLPGETNRTSTIAYEANYIVHTVGFQPTLWAIGNEPTGWTHYGIPWASWNTADNSLATPHAYALEIRNAVPAITAVDPTAKFDGIQAAYYGNSQWFADLAQNYSTTPFAWVAYHMYPTNGIANPTQIYSVLSGTTNITSTYAVVRSDLTSNCPSGSTACKTTPIEIGEYNHGPATGTPYSDANFTDAVFLAASVTQALRDSVSALTIFKLQSSGATYGYSLMNSTNATDPAGTLFQKVLGNGHFQLYGSVHNTSVATTATNVWAEMTRNTSSCYNGLIVANANTVDGLNLSLSTVFPTSTSGTITWWNASTNSSGPVTKTGAVIGSTIAMAPQSLLVLKDHSCTGESVSKSTSSATDRAGLFDSDGPTTPYLARQLDPR